MLKTGRDVRNLIRYAFADDEAAVSRIRTKYGSDSLLDGQELIRLLFPREVVEWLERECAR